ncbi:MAG: hypothetical protein WA139_01115 [Candidatus Aenigmatarchaeota archaeon]
MLEQNKRGDVVKFLGIPLPSKKQITSFFEEDAAGSGDILETRIERYIESLGKKEADMTDIITALKIPWGSQSDSEYNKTYKNIILILDRLVKEGKTKHNGYRTIRGAGCCEEFHIPKYSGV